MTGVRVTAPKPTIFPDPFSAFKVADADLQVLVAGRPFPTMATAEDTWAPVKPSDDIKTQYEVVLAAWVNPVRRKGSTGVCGYLGPEPGME
ncbi:hypothetical protein DER45DRAFT_551650 [Fusarium avenaceum]|nr:hypothetical protein DER45DRAFT_551650 [Fusarium avenaceum]